MKLIQNAVSFFTIARNAFVNWASVSKGKLVSCVCKQLQWSTFKHDAELDEYRSVLCRTFAFVEWIETLSSYVYNFFMTLWFSYDMFTIHNGYLSKANHKIIMKVWEAQTKWHIPYSFAMKAIITLENETFFYYLNSKSFIQK